MKMIFNKARRKRMLPLALTLFALTLVGCSDGTEADLSSLEAELSSLKSRSQQQDAKQAWIDAYSSGDYEHARPLLDKACKDGNFIPCGFLGYLFENGLGGAQDLARAWTLYDKACKGGDFAGCNKLGVMFYDGIGVARDRARARTLFDKACKGGFENGCIYLKNF